MKGKKENAHLEYLNKIQEIKKQGKENALEFVKKFEETKKLRYLRHAIKNDYELLYKDERMKSWLYEIRYKAARPYVNAETKEAREFLEEISLLKPEKIGQMQVFFGLSYCLESCLGMKFVHGSEPQLMADDNAALVYFVNKLKRQWKDFCENIGKKKFRIEDRKEERVVEFCKNIGLEITEEELNWGSVYDLTDIALTIVGVANLKRWGNISKYAPKHELNKILGDFPYFSFGVLEKLYKRVKKEVDSTKLSDVGKKIISTQKNKNPFFIKYEGMPMNIYLVANPRKIT